MSAVDPAGHEIVPRPFGSRFAQNRCLDFRKALAVKKLSGYFCDFMPKRQISLHPPFSQIQVPVFQPEILRHVVVVLDIDWRCVGFRVDRQFIGKDLDIPCGELLVFCLPFLYDSFDPDDIFGSQAIRLLKQLFRAVSSNTICTIPVLSRRSQKISPPRFRRL